MNWDIPVTFKKCRLAESNLYEFSTNLASTMSPKIKSNTFGPIPFNSLQGLAFWGKTPILELQYSGNHSQRYDVYLRSFHIWRPHICQNLKHNVALNMSKLEASDKAVSKIFCPDYPFFDPKIFERLLQKVDHLCRKHLFEELSRIQKPGIRQTVSHNFLYGSILEWCHPICQLIESRIPPILVSF